MQNASMANKVKILWDGVDIPGLVRLGEVPQEDGSIDVPSPSKIVKISTGVTQMPEIPATYETQRNTITRKFFQDFHRNKEVKDCTVIRFDASGVEFARELWSSVECRRFSDPEVDHGSVSYSKIDVILLPYDITPVDVS